MTIDTTLLGANYQEQTQESEHDAFDCIRIGLSSPQRMLSWSRGEVTKPETINYRTLKPERDGLFCERTFGPAKDWECHCGKYKRVRHRGIICERCGVEVTDSKVRRHRMGHIRLAAPVVHVWYLKGIPSYMSLLLDMPLRALEEITYYNAYVVLKDATLTLNPTVEEDEIVAETEATEGSGGKAPEPEEAINLSKGQLLTEDQFEQLCDRYGDDSFEAEMGAPAIKKLLGALDCKKEAEYIWGELEKKPSNQKKIKFIKRLRVMENFINSGANPTWMVLDVVPVIPPDLRPMVQLDGGRFATSDLNDLYRRVINRNNRLIRLLEMEAPDIIIRNEKRMLQEAVDALFDNGRRGRVVVGPNNRPLKSLSDIVEGKQGRFRQNLLGKRVDYSGRSVIVVGPSLKLHQCGLPKEMALELFKPFVMNKLVERGVVQNIKSAKKTIERQESVVWDILEDVIKGHPILLNRAPTLHRLGIQAFESVLVEGRAIQLHPLVCTAFNADFDGDQMAVHVPLSIEAQTEARLLMMADKNILLPATGKPVVKPSQDMVIGCYYVTTDNPTPGLKGADKIFGSTSEALTAYHAGQIHLHAKVVVRIPLSQLPDNEPVMLKLEGKEKKSGGVVRGVFKGFEGKTLGDLKASNDSLPARGFIHTTAGRMLINEYFPEDYLFQNKIFGGPQLSDLIADCYQKYGEIITSQLANDLKDAGFHFATIAGISITISDLEIPEQKKGIIAESEKAIEEAQYKFQRGMITEAERYSRVINIWHTATEDVTDKIKTDYNRLNNVYMMAFSGARGNISQVRQLVGMRGLMADPSGRIIDLPIKSNFKEGLNVTEYVLSSYGARKGIVDTALRTADSGYLTRRLADVAQDVIILDEDCETEQYFELTEIRDGENVMAGLEERLTGRVAAVEIAHPKTKEVFVERNEVITKAVAKQIEAAGLDNIKVRSPFGCQSEFGVCRLCYGWSLTTKRLVDKGEPVGIIAAQSIGEPGTQLTMRTFHTGGVFEGSRAQRIMAPSAGELDYGDAEIQTQLIRTQIGDEVKVLDKDIEININVKKRKRPVKVNIPAGFSLLVENGMEVEKDQPLAVAVSESGKFGRGSMEKVTKQLISDISGRVQLHGFAEELRQTKQKSSSETRVANKDGSLWVYSGDVYPLPPRCDVIVKDEQQVKDGDPIARIATTTDYGGRVMVDSDNKGNTTIILTAAELKIPGAHIESNENEITLHFGEKSPVDVFKLFVNHDARLENNTVIAEAVDERYVIERNGTIHYIPENTKHKEPIIKDLKAILLFEESYTVKGDTIFIDDDMEIKAGTELLPGIAVEEDGFLSTENLDTSQEFLFFPGAKAYFFTDGEDTKIAVKEGAKIKKKAALGEMLNPDTGKIEKITSPIEGIIHMIPSEDETIIVVRPYQQYQISPLDKFFEAEQSSEKINLETVTRLSNRHGDRLKAGTALTKIQLQFNLLEEMAALGGRVFFDDAGDNKALRLASLELLTSRKQTNQALLSHELAVSTIPLVKDGDVVEAKQQVAYTEYKVRNDGTLFLHQDAHTGVGRVMLLTSEHEFLIETGGAKVLVKKGDPVFESDEIAEGLHSSDTGLVMDVTKKGILFRRARPYLVNQGSQLMITKGSMVKQGEVLAILTYEQMKTGDIIQGLPRVEELLETRKPKQGCVLSEYDGTVKITINEDDSTVVSIVDKDGVDHSVNIPFYAAVIVIDGQKVKRGDVLTSGAVNPHDLLKILDIVASQRYLVDNVQKVYRSQGVRISDKHIEVIVRQMTRKRRIDDPGDSTFLPGEIVTEPKITMEQKRMEKLGLNTHIEFAPILLGITKASLNTESFISAASFQETTRVLTEAAMEGKRDWLRGLKENVIIGRLIPAGTGMRTAESRQKYADKRRSVETSVGSSSTPLTADNA